MVVRPPLNCPKAAGTVKVTGTWAIGRPWALMSTTWKRRPVLGMATVCSVIGSSRAPAGSGRLLLVRWMVVIGLLPARAWAVTVYEPAKALAKAVAVAMPELSVVTVMVLVPLLNLPLAPLAGAVNVTLALASGLPNWSLTRTTSAAKAVLTVADWLLPETTAMLAATGTA